MNDPTHISHADDQLDPTQLNRLPREIEPPRDLWPGIAARLQTPRAAPRSSHAYRWLPLATAASLLVAVGAALFSYHNLRTQSPPALAQTLDWTPGVPARQVAHIEQLHAAERQRLRQTLAARATSMDTQTLATLRKNLEIMDRASEEIRAAIKAQPQNGQWVNLLLDNYQQEFEMLNYLLLEQPYTDI